MKKKVLVMGVSGTGKSLVGGLIANALNAPFVDGDDFHPQCNLDKMREGVPLTDDDRQGWLKTLNQQFIQYDQLVLACSALKPEYRNLLKENNQELIIVYLQGSFETILSRHKKRQNHFFKGEKMLRSQFDTLVEPSNDEAIFVDIEQAVDPIVEQALMAIEKR